MEPQKSVSVLNLSGKGLQWNGVWFEALSLRQLTSQPFPDCGIASQQLNRQVLTFLHQWYDESADIELSTSGSTGKPKTIRIAKQYMVNSAMMTGNFFELKPGNNALLCLSPKYIAGKMMIVRSLVLGLNLISQSIEECFRNESATHIDFAAMVPLQVAHLLRDNPEAFNYIRTLIIGGSAISSSIESALQSVATKCWHTYAMTETVSHVALRPINGKHRTTWFSLLEGVSVSINAAGCLCIHAPHLARHMVETNDLALMNKGKFKILGRTDDVVISAGHKIHLAEIERKLGTVLHLPFFLAAENHQDAGQIVVLYIEDNLHFLTIEGLATMLETLLPSHEKPRKIYKIDSFAYLGSGKIDKKGTIIMHSQLQK